MTRNIELLVKVRECEEKYGSVTAAPNLDELHEMATKNVDPGFKDKTFELRQLIYRGFTVKEICEVRGLDKAYVGHLRRKVRDLPGFEFKATRDDLVQLEYNIAHGKKISTHNIASAMRRDSDWVSAMIRVVNREERTNQEVK